MKNGTKGDLILRALVCDDQVNLVAIDGKNLCERAREIHSASRVCTSAMGRTLMVSAMMGAMLKGEDDKLTVMVKGGGPAGNIICCARPDCTVKGYIENPSLELPLGPDGKLDVSSAVGWYGNLTVIRDLGMKEPYIGRCDMVSGEIAEDFARYFTVSEQQPSLVYLGLREDPDTGAVTGAGGLMLMPLPGCPEEVLNELTDRAEGIKALTGMLDEGMTLDTALEKLLNGLGLRVTERSEPRFSCDCSRGRLEQVLISMGREELADMIENDHGAELTCHFCNTAYKFDEEQLTSLIMEACSHAKKEELN